MTGLFFWPERGIPWSFRKIPKKFLARLEKREGGTLPIFHPERGNPLRFFAAAEVPFLPTYIAKMSVFLQVKKSSGIAFLRNPRQSTSMLALCFPEIQ